MQTFNDVVKMNKEQAYAYEKLGFVEGYIAERALACIV